MKVLITYNLENADNLFVPTLFNALLEHGVDVVCSVNEFWNPKFKYDIIHIQWPEEFVGWNNPDERRLTRLEEKIGEYQKMGVKIIYNRHNTIPHFNNPIMTKAYSVVERNSDVFVHLGNYSRKQSISSYPDKVHVVIPHHIYEKVYDESISVSAARRFLNIEESKFVITAFGKFRHKKEIVMTLIPFLLYGKYRKYLVSPRLIPASIRGGTLFLLKRILLFFHIRSNSNEVVIPNEELPYYLIASDLVFIQRCDILNSGNIPQAFLFRKVVVGPNTGNIGELLRETGNPVFEPTHYLSILNALKQGYKLQKEGKGISNYKYAMETMNLNRVVKLYINVYKNLV